MLAFPPDPGADRLLHSLLDHLLHAGSILEPEERGLSPDLSRWTVPLAPAKPESQGGGDRTRISSPLKQPGSRQSGAGERGCFRHLRAPRPGPAGPGGLEPVPEQGCPGCPSAPAPRPAAGEGGADVLTWGLTATVGQALTSYDWRSVESCFLVLGALGRKQSRCFQLGPEA